MAVFKRYNTRRRRIRWGFVIWLLAIAVIFAATAALGYYLGKKAEGGIDLLPKDLEKAQNEHILAPLTDESISGEYSTPENLQSFVSDKENVRVGSWLYKDGASYFATEIEELTKNSATPLPSLSNFDINYKTYGFFEVSSIYADERIRALANSYEKLLIDEFSAEGPDEIILVFNNVTEENFRDIIDFSKSITCEKFVAIPYQTIYESFCTRFLSEAAGEGLRIALKAEDLTDDALTADIATYGFFTKYKIPLIIEGKDAHLVDTLFENAVYNYFFASERTAEVPAGQ